MPLLHLPVLALTPPARAIPALQSLTLSAKGTLEQTKIRPNDLEGSAEPFVPLDSIGGCTTLIRADVHREGALFPPNYAIGGTWDTDGYDGVETEGGWAGGWGVGGREGGRVGGWEF